MVKTRFRGERKRKGTRPQAIGNRGSMTENQKKPPPYTYPAFAGFLQRGNCSEGKGEKSRKRLLKGSIFLKSKKMYYLCTF